MSLVGGTSWCFPSFLALGNIWVMDGSPEHLAPRISWEHLAPRILTCLYGGAGIPCPWARSTPMLHTLAVAV